MCCPLSTIIGMGADEPIQKVVATFHTVIKATAETVRIRLSKSGLVVK